MSSTVVVSSVVGAVALAYGYIQYSKGSAHQSDSHLDTSINKLVQAAGTQSQAGKKNKKKKKADGASPSPALETETERKPVVVRFPPVASVPGEFDSGSNASLEPSEPAQPKVKKAKKKKAKRAAPAGTQSDSSAGAGPSSSLHSLQPISAGGKPEQKETLSVDTDSSWTQVNSRRRKEASDAAPSAEHTSDAGLAASSVGERSEEEAEEVNRKTFAEKMLPKPRKTGVEDMTETPDYPGVARVMRVQPQPGEEPAAGFSWADYEDVNVGDDADGEDDGGWGVVKSRSRRKATPPATSEFKAPETLTKKQRQNAARKEAERAAKVQAEAERQAALAKHKRELERIRMAEQFNASKGKKPSGGMSAAVDEKGKLVWE